MLAALRLSAVVPAVPSFRHITCQEGLPYTWVTDIFKDSRDYMWFSTIYGTWRYDGTFFREYSFRDSGGSARATVSMVREDSHGRLWFCTHDGLYRYDPALSPAAEAVIPGRAVYSIAEDGDNSLWAAASGGVFRISPDASFGDKPVPGIPDGVRPSAVFCDSGKMIWVGTTGGSLFRFNQLEGAFAAVGLPLRISASVSCILEDREHVIWIGTLGDGLWSLNPRSGMQRHWCVDNGGLKHDLVRSLAQDSRGRIVAATEMGLAVIEDGEHSSFILSDPSSPKSLNDNAAYSVYFDDEDNLWVGTFFGGVNLSYSGEKLFDSVLSSALEYSAGSKVVSSIMPYGDGLMVGTENDGIFVISPEGREISHIRSAGTGLSGDNVHSLCQDNHGNLWVGTYCGGLSLRKAAAGRFRTFRTDNSALSSDNIYVVRQDSRGNLWVGTQYGGLYRYNYGTSRLERFPEDLPGNLFIWDIHEGRDGSIWLAAFGGGLWKLSVADGYHAEHIPTPASQFIRICELRDGRFLLGTEKEGLVEFNPITLESRLVGMQDGLPDDTIYGILQDDEGRIWMSSNSGLIMADEACSRFAGYTMSDGLPTNRFNYNACIKAGGVLYFGSTNGVVKIQPSLAQGSRSRLRKVRFTGLMVSGELQPCGEYSGKITLSRKENTFSIFFSDNTYSLPASKYAYQVQGLNSSWHDLGLGRRIDFLSLRPGNYTLRVAPSEGSISEDETATIHIRVLPPWWASTLAKIVYIIMAAGLLAAAVGAIIVKQRKRQRLALEKLAREKDEEINEIKKRLLLNESSDGFLVRKVADYIYAHSQDSTLGVDALCAAVGISKTSLYRKMKAVTGLSATEFIGNVRIENAARMLAESDRTISEVAYEAGFTDPYYFSRAFKKVHGCSPKTWREHKRKEHKTND